MQCDYFDRGECRSCTLMGVPYPVQLGAKQARCEETLHSGIRWLPPYSSDEAGFRSKAKLAIGGTVDAPTLGILDANLLGVDLRECGVHADGIRGALPALAAFITLAGLVPYDVPSRVGELKHVLVTESPDGQLMLRFVLRSTEPVQRMRKHLPWLLAALPVRVVSANLLPHHVAVLEGPDELVLTDHTTLPMRVADLTLHLGTRSFFQTNVPVAGGLYRQAREWVDAVAPATVWDLYCGVGGFALAVADASRSVLGVEASEEAIASAERTRLEAGLTSVSFEAGDATAFAVSAGTPPDLVIVNPPRRGLGRELADWLENSGVRDVIYSSCSLESLARDLQRMPSLRPVEGRVFDMFPQTEHLEVMVRLARE